MAPDQKRDNLRPQLKDLPVENLMVQVPPADIGDEQPLFSPGSLGLDSVDALQIVVALEKPFSLNVFVASKEILRSMSTLADAVIVRRRGPAAVSLSEVHTGPGIGTMAELTIATHERAHRIPQGWEHLG